MIEGVKVKKLKVIPDERGRLMEMLRADDGFFTKFGQAYMTTAYPGVVKGWHYHKIQDDNMVIVDVGLDAAEAFALNHFDGFTHIAIGTGTGAEVPSSTALGNEVARRTFESSTKNTGAGT